MLILYSIIISVAYFGYKTISFIYKIEYFKSQKKYQPDGTKPKVLIVLSTSPLVGGIEIHCLSLYRRLLENNYDAQMLVVKNSGLAQKLQELQLPHYTYNKIIIRKNTFQPGLYSGMYKICKDHNIQIINCNFDKELRYAKKVAKKLNIHAILTNHSQSTIRHKYIKDSKNSTSLDGVIHCGPLMFKKQIEENKKQNLNIKHLEFITHFFEEQPFLNFKTNNTKNEFFENEFGIKLKNFPIICMVANMYKNTQHKNHRLLLQAVHKLIHEKNKYLQVVLAGNGPEEEELKQLARDLKISDYVYFLGFTNKIPEVLYHSDIKAVISNKETFGLVFLEAALLKKPLVCATKTGVADVVVLNEKTGLIFENNNLDSLVDQLGKLIDNPAMCKTLGQNAYEHVMKNFLPDISLQQTDAFYKKVLNS